MTNTLRPLHRISDELVPMLSALPDTAMAKWAGLEQARCLRYLETCRDDYGMDSGSYVVACLLGNITGWRGPEAKRIRAELKAHLAAVKR